jgi:hypothetical protein
MVLLSALHTRQLRIAHNVAASASGSLPQLALGFQNMGSGPQFRSRTMVDRGTPPGPVVGRYNMLWGPDMRIHALALQHMRGVNARHSSLAQHLAPSSLHMRHPPRTLCRLCTMRGKHCGLHKGTSARCAQYKPTDATMPTGRVPGV